MLILLRQQVKFLAGFEADGFAGRNGNLGAGPRIPTNTCLSGFHGEDAEAAQLDAVPLHERSFHAVEDGIDSCFGLGTRQSGAFDNPLYQVLLNHLSKDPSLWIP